jgi:chromate reductase
MSATPLRLLGISGSLRADSYSTAILKTLAGNVFPRATFEFANIGALPLYNQDLDVNAAIAPVVALKEQVSAADGVVIVSTEFNHGMPGVLKNALDWTSRPVFRSPFKDKPVLIITTSMAFTGGVRAQYQIRETLTSMLARPVATPEVVIGIAQNKVVDGRLVDRAAIDFALSAFETLFSEIHLQAHAEHRVAALAH